MARVTVEDCLANVPNRFFLVLLAAERTKQLLKGDGSLIEDYRKNKEVVTSLREIAASKIMPDLSGFDENLVSEAGAGPLEDLPPRYEEELPPEAGD